MAIVSGYTGQTLRAALYYQKALVDSRCLHLNSNLSDLKQVIEIFWALILDCDSRFNRVAEVEVFFHLEIHFSYMLQMIIQV